MFCKGCNEESWAQPDRCRGHISSHFIIHNIFCKQIKQCMLPNKRFIWDMFHAYFSKAFWSTQSQVYDIINKIDDDTGHLDFQVRPIKPNFVFKLVRQFSTIPKSKLSFYHDLKLFLAGVHLHHDRAEQGQWSGKQLQGGFQVWLSFITRPKQSVCKLSDESHYTVKLQS